MLLVDTVKGELIEDETLKNDYAKRQPYGEWLDHNLYPLADLKIRTSVRSGIMAWN